MNQLKTGFIRLGADKTTSSTALTLTLSSQQAIPVSGHNSHFYVRQMEKKIIKSVTYILKNNEGQQMSVWR